MRIEKKMNLRNDLVPVSDLYVAGYLLAKGEKIFHVDRRNEGRPKKITFYFRSNIEETIQEYFNGASISAIGFRNAIENCKSIIFDFD